MTERKPLRQGPWRVISFEKSAKSSSADSESWSSEFMNPRPDILPPFHRLS